MWFFFCTVRLWNKIQDDLWVIDPLMWSLAKCQNIARPFRRFIVLRGRISLLRKGTVNRNRRQVKMTLKRYLAEMCFYIFTHYKEFWITVVEISEGHTKTDLKYYNTCCWASPYFTIMPVRTSNVSSPWSCFVSVKAEAALIRPLRLQGLLGGVACVK